MKEFDLVCFSHLRWNFVFQRPQHLLTRFSNDRRVFYVEELVFADHDHMEVTQIQENLWIVVPHLVNKGTNEEQANRQNILLQKLFAENKLKEYIFWYYTPMSLDFTDSFNPALVVYDCMDELSAFKFAPVALKSNEEKLFKKADLVFTGGHSLYKAKKDRHSAIYPFPSSIEKEHFAKARFDIAEPADQVTIPHPRIGFYGVIDERMDLDLITKVAAERPDWHFVIIGPVVKIDEKSLPRFSNIHYLGNKSYQELPTYLAGWDIAIIPFALNESTRFISPTKTPEYLAAGKPVISSSIQDVITPYGDNKLVYIADNAGEFIAAAEEVLSMEDRDLWLSNVDSFLCDNSWDNTWSQMMQHIIKKSNNKAQETKLNKLNEKEYIYV